MKNQFNKIFENEFRLISVVLIILLTIFFHRSIFFGEINSASGILQSSPMFQLPDYKNFKINSLWGDPLQQTEPWRFFSSRSLNNGEFPLWNDLQSAGIPHFANMQSAVLYPLNLFFYFFNMKLATFLFYFMKLFIIGIFTYYFLRELYYQKYTSILGTIAFMFFGLNICWFYYAIANVIFFLPASLLIFERIFKANNIDSIIKYFIVYSFLFAVALFGGHPETFVHILIFSSAYFVYLLLNSNHESKMKVKIIAFFLGANFAGILVSMIQLLPFLEYLSLSEKLMLRNEVGTGSLLYFTFILNLIPDFYGNQTLGGFFPYYAAPANYNELGGGHIGLFMITFAFLGTKYFFNDKKFSFLWIVAIIFSGVAYGLYPISNIFNKLPILKLAANSRIYFISAFIFIIIACKTFDDFYFKKAEIKNRNVNLLFIIMILMIIISWFLTWKWFPILLPEWEVKKNTFLIIRTQIISVSIGIISLFFIKWIILHCKNEKYKYVISIIIPLFVFIETGIHGMLYIPTVKEKYFYPANPFINKIKFDNTGHYRSTVKDIFYPTNVNVAYDLADIRNYDAINILRYKEFINHVINYQGENFQDIPEINSTLLNFMGVKYIITNTEEMPPIYKLIMKNVEKNIFLFENLNVFDRAYIVNKFKVIKNDFEILDFIKNERVDLLREVILEEDPSIDVPFSQNIENYKTQATITAYKSNLVKIQTKLEKPGFLVLSDNHFPGWKAFVNEEETKIYRANYTFRAILLPKGNHEVTFKYDPLAFKVGMVITIASLLLLFLTFAYLVFLRKKVFLVQEN